MTRPTQKQREVALVERLVTHVPEIQGLCVESLPVDPPDIRLAEDFGVEVTGFHRRGGEAPQAAVEKMRCAVTKRPQAIHEGVSLRPLDVRIHFRDGVIPKAMAEALAVQLAEAARLPGLPLRVSGYDLPDPARAYVFSISVRECSGPRPWDCLSGDSVETSWDAVEQLARAKEGDLARWPAWAKRRWLLIAAGGTEMVDGRETLLFSSMFPLMDLLPAPDLRTAFDRVYFLDVMTDTVRRLA